MLSLSNSLSRTRYGILDADAAAYVAAVESALGSSITFTQRRAIDTFIKGEKAASRYTLLKRLYLPIWGQAAANAIDMISLTSGTFNGGVTHGAGYMQGNGSTGYFNMGVSPSTLGLSTGSALTCSLVYEIAGAGNIINIGTYDGTTVIASENSAGGIQNYYPGFTGPTLSVLRADQAGIESFSRLSTTSGQIKLRKTAGVSSSSVYTTLVTGDPPASNLYGLAYNNNGAAGFHSFAKIGCLCVGLGTSAVNVDGFTLSLKNLWETTTGLTLP